MKLTPLDIHHKEFNHALRGYNEAEVDAFLDQVADELERLFKENIDLSEKIEALEEKVRSYQDMERTLHNTLLSAQKSADEIVTKAQHEAEVVLKDAEVKAKEVIHNALTNKQKATNDLTRIKQAEEEFRVAFKSLLESHMRALHEVPVADDVKLMIGRAGEETLADADVAPAPETAAPAARTAPAAREAVSAPTAEKPAAPSRPVEPEAPGAVAVEPPDSGFVASLHLGDLGTAEIPEDATVEFDVSEFGFGDREDDIDIEEID